MNLFPLFELALKNGAPGLAEPARQALARNLAIKIERGALIQAVEYGFKSAERGNNLEKTLSEWHNEERNY